jgi:hypothetical protein
MFDPSDQAGQSRGPQVDHSAKGKDKDKDKKKGNKYEVYYRELSGCTDL